MAATERDADAPRAPHPLGSVVLAALALPGVMPAQAEEAPERGYIAVKMLNYRDWQPGLDRIRVDSPSVYVLAPLSRQMAVEGSLVVDSVSGATPRYHSSISGATAKMSDHRTAADVKLTRYFDRSAIAVGAAYSKENDYESQAASLEARWSTEDNNTTFNLGLGGANDRIGSTNDPSLDKRRRTSEFTVGVTQALSARDLVQFGLTHNSGRGFYNDPYKSPDVRPDRRDQTIALLRWNRYLDFADAALRSSYRFYNDSFGVRAHTFGLEWAQPVAPQWTVTPALRYYTQRAASFYYDPVYDTTLGEPYPAGYLTNPPTYLSADQRLSAFGALTFGLRLDWQASPDWSADVKVERYTQRASWRIGGDGSPGLDPFHAASIQVGLRRRF